MSAEGTFAVALVGVGSRVILGTARKAVLIAYMVPKIEERSEWAEGEGDSQADGGETELTDAAQVETLQKADERLAKDMGVGIARIARKFDDLTTRRLLDQPGSQSLRGAFGFEVNMSMV